MLEILRQRLASKTYQVALVGALLTILETNMGFITGYVPVEYRTYLIMLWPVVMLSLREVTKTALADK